MQTALSVVVIVLLVAVGVLAFWVRRLAKWNRNKERERDEAHVQIRRRKKEIAERSRQINGLQGTLARTLSEHRQHVQAVREEYEAQRQRSVDEAVAAYRERLRAVTASLDKLLEPSRGDDCNKIRFHRDEEAQAFARELERDTGAEEGSMIVYPCRVCPRSPWTIEKVRHVSHAKPEARGQHYWTDPAPGRPIKPTRLAARINPAHVAALMQRAQKKENSSNA